MTTRTSWPSARRALGSEPATSARPPFLAKGSTSALKQRILSDWGIGFCSWDGSKCNRAGQVVNWQRMGKDVAEGAKSCVTREAATKSAAHALLWYKGAHGHQA